MDDDSIAIVMGMILGALMTLVFMVLLTSVFNNSGTDIGLSQETGDAVCQSLTGNPEAYAVDWDETMEEPEDSLVCKIPTDNPVEKGLIRIEKD